MKILRRSINLKRKLTIVQNSFVYDRGAQEVIGIKLTTFSKKVMNSPTGNF